MATPTRARTSQAFGFTLIELLVVVAVIALLIGLLLPALATSRLTALKLTNSNQLRSLQQGLINFSQTNNDWYTGYDASAGVWKATWLNYPDYADIAITGNHTGTDARIRFYELVAADFALPEMLIHPNDPDSAFKSVWTPQDTNFDYQNFSYSLNELGWGSVGHPDETEYRFVRRAWKNDLNANTPVIADRLYDIVNPATGQAGQQWNIEHYVGMYSNTPGAIEIALVWNDGHTTFATSPLVGNTRFSSVTNSLDNIYSRGSESGYNRQSGVSGTNPNGEPFNVMEGSSAKFNSWGSWESVQPKPGA